MLTRLRLENFKSWEDTGGIKLKPITGFFGPNSSGKTSLFQALLLMKQTAESSDRGIVFHFGNEKTLVDLGDFESVVHKHDTKRGLKLSVEWSAKREFAIPDRFGSGAMDEGDDIRFDVALQEQSIDSVKSLMLEEMSYQITGNRRFGLRRIPSRRAHEAFACGPSFQTNISADRYSTGLRPSSFYRFPYWADRNRDFFFSLAYELTLLLDDLYYLGPLRASPNRTYAWSGAQPLGTGPAGEFMVDAILSSREQYQRESESPHINLAEYIAEQLKRLRLVHDFRVEALAEGRRIFEVKVRKSPNSPEVLLTDVGFGVSQILPVLTLCFYAPEGSILIFEQPDIHLHPSVQAGLADVFIDACKRRNVQILFESHSEHLLRRLQRRIAEEEIPEDDIGLYFCSTDDSGTSNLSELEVDKFGNIANWPKDFFGDQFGEIAAMSEAALKRQVASE